MLLRGRPRSIGIDAGALISRARSQAAYENLARPAICNQGTVVFGDHRSARFLREGDGGRDERQSSENGNADVLHFISKSAICSTLTPSAGRVHPLLPGRVRAPAPVAGHGNGAIAYAMSPPARAMTVVPLFSESDLPLRCSGVMCRIAVAAESKLDAGSRVICFNITDFKWI